MSELFCWNQQNSEHRLCQPQKHFRTLSGKKETPTKGKAITKVEQVEYDILAEIVEMAIVYLLHNQ